MTRVINVCEKCNNAIPASVPLVIAAAAQDVLPAVDPKTEVAFRSIQNVGGANPTFWAIGQDCSAVSYHGSLAAGATLTLPLSICAQRVSCYSAAGTSVVVCVIVRNDLSTAQNILPS